MCALALKSLSLNLFCEVFSFFLSINLPVWTSPQYCLNHFFTHLSILDKSACTILFYSFNVVFKVFSWWNLYCLWCVKRTGWNSKCNSYHNFHYRMIILQNVQISIIFSIDETFCTLTFLTLNWTVKCLETFFYSLLVRLNFWVCLEREFASLYSSSWNLFF